jgi:rhomboid family GlyGly-CTERM serine protease
MTSGTESTAVSSVCGRVAFALTVGVVVALAVLLTELPDQPVRDLGWRADAAGEVWRCLSCHFVHLGVRHLAVNLAAFLVLAAVAAVWERQAGFGAALLAGMLSVCAGLGLTDLGVQWYVGLSGALHGLFAWLVLGRALRNDTTGKIAAGLYFAGILKVLLDMGIPVGSPGLAGVAVAPPGHLLGYLGGSLWVFACRLLRRALRLDR